jgi:hypothetical protein
LQMFCFGFNFPNKINQGRLNEEIKLLFLFPNLLFLSIVSYFPSIRCVKKSMKTANNIVLHFTAVHGTKKKKSPSSLWFRTGLILIRLAVRT